MVLDKTFSEIIESLNSQMLIENNQVEKKKQQANLTLIKSQLELIKSSYDQIIKKLSDTQPI